MNPSGSILRAVRSPGFFWFLRQGFRTGATGCLTIAFCLASASLRADTNNVALAAPPIPDATVSLLRVMGALALVLGLFLCGVWLFKNWQRLATQRGRQPGLNILESRSLGARQSVFVVGYEHQRFLVATSPAGVNLLSHLPDADAQPDGARPAETPAGPISFGQALSQVLKRK